MGFFFIILIQSTPQWPFVSRRKARCKWISWEWFFFFFLKHQPSYSGGGERSPLRCIYQINLSCCCQRSEWNAVFCCPSDYVNKKRLEETLVNPLPSLTLFFYCFHVITSPCQSRRRASSPLSRSLTHSFHHLAAVTNNSDHKHLYFGYLWKIKCIWCLGLFSPPPTALLQSVGCSEGSCCVSGITLAFNLTKSLRLKRGSFDWQASPADVGAPHTARLAFSGERSAACVCVSVCVIWNAWSYSWTI